MRLAFAVCLGLALIGAACSLSDSRGRPDARASVKEPVPTVEVAATAAPVASMPGSAGCGSVVARGLTLGSVEAGGLVRTYRLYVPSTYEDDRPAALVINYHGLGNTAEHQERYSGYAGAAEKYGFVVVSPQATSVPSEWFLYGPAESAYVDDFAFTDRLLDALEASLCIDPARVYATGLSNGGGMTALAGCALSRRIAATAPVAGEPYVAGECDGAGPVPIVAFHGTADPLVPFEEAPDAGRPDIFRHGARNNMAAWARHNGCDPEPRTERVTEDVVLESYGGCRDGADVYLYLIEGGGHTWPGAAADMPGVGATTRSISATELSWRFFAAHAR